MYDLYMVNKLILKELEKLEIAKPEPYDALKHEYFIPKFQEKKLEVGKYYILKLSENVINPPPSSTLSCNWNNNTKPESKYVKCSVLMIMGSMIKIDSLSYNYDKKEDGDKRWVGWIGKSDAEIIQVL